MKKTFLLGFAAFALFAFAAGVVAQKPADDPKAKSVTEELEALANESEGRVPPKVLAAGKKGVEEIRASGILEKALNVGGRMPAFTLRDAFDNEINSGELLKKGNLIIVFYRGAWCPYCNLYLRGIQRRLGEFRAQDANLIAISVEPPDRSLAISKRNKLDFTVLSDPGLEVARKFGIVYELPKVVNDVVLELGFDIAKYNSMEKAELPLGATYIVSREGKVIYAFLEADYKKRADLDVMLSSLRNLRRSRAAREK